LFIVGEKLTISIVETMMFWIIGETLYVIPMWFIIRTAKAKINVDKKGTK